MPLRVEAEMVANVLAIQVEVGDRVEVGQTLVLLESMKMEIPVSSPRAGRVATVHVAPEDKVAEGQVLVSLETD